MKINTIAPFEGELVWLGEMRQGVSQKGKEWQAIDFVIKYKDGKYDSRLQLQAFGAEKVGLIMAAGIGSTIRVEWLPSSREYNGRWYTNLEAKEVSVVDEQKPAKKTAERMPDGAVIHPGTQAPTFPNARTESNASSATAEDKDEDLPFNWAPGVRG